MLQRFLTPWRMKWYSASILFAMAVGFLLCVFSGSGRVILSGRLGGDFPTFYSIGRMIAKGDWQEIYNQERQIAEQKPFMGKEKAYLPFGYPPYVALIYWPLSLLPYRIAYTAHTLIMVMALFMTLHLIRPMNEQIHKHFMFAFTLSLSFFPIFKAVIGGQNTAITMLLIALSWEALKENCDYRAGVFTGLMLFKPQFALPLAGVYLLSGRWRIVVGFAFIAVIFYVFGILVIGPDWVAIWLEHAKWQIQAYSVIDKANAVSWLGFSKAVFGAGDQWALIIGWVLSLLTAIGISLIWWANRWKNDLTALIGMTSVCLVLLPPHVIFYDAGLLLFAFAAIATRPLKLKFEIFGLIWLLSWSHVLADHIGFSPLFFITVGTGILAAYTLILPGLKNRQLQKN